jgi:hypothetical protein
MFPVGRQAKPADIAHYEHPGRQFLPASRTIARLPMQTCAGGVDAIFGNAFRVDDVEDPTREMPRGETVALCGMFE